MTDQHRPQAAEEQAAAYALGALPIEEQVVFEKRLALSQHDLQVATKAFRAVADQLDLGVQALAPRASLRERVLTHIAQEADRDDRMYQSMADRLAFATTPLVPPTSLRDRLLERVRNEVRPSRQAIPPLTFVKASEGEWVEMASGVTAKILYFDPVSRRATALVRMAPGSVYAPHRHAEPEEFFVLEGGCFCGGQELVVGDYHRAEAGTEHHDTSSDDGCLLLIISSPQNEMLS